MLGENRRTNRRLRTTAEAYCRDPSSCDTGGHVIKVASTGSEQRDPHRPLIRPEIVDIRPSSGKVAPDGALTGRCSASCFQLFGDSGGRPGIVLFVDVLAGPLPARMAKIDKFRSAPRTAPKIGKVPLSPKRRIHVGSREGSGRGGQTDLPQFRVT